MPQWSMCRVDGENKNGIKQNGQKDSKQAAPAGDVATFSAYDRITGRLVIPHFKHVILSFPGRHFSTEISYTKH